MSTVKQIEANNLNAKKSTGPRSRPGKLRSRQNALRHGLTAETVITALENADDYKVFESNVVADYQPRNGVEQLLVLRLASLLWRLRRSVAIETGLFEAQGRMLKARRVQRKIQAGSDLRTAALRNSGQYTEASFSPEKAEPQSESPDEYEQPHLSAWQPSVSECFFRLTSERGDVLARIERHEAGLWRQVAQTISTINSCRK
jgi:hypothetical protein